MPSLDGATEWINGAPPVLEGRPCLVHFWSMGSAFALEQVPRIVRWRDGFAARGLAVIGIHRPGAEAETEVARVKAVAGEHQMAYPIAVDNTHAISDAFQCDRVPSLYLFDVTGRLRYHQFGPGTEVLARALEEVMLFAR